jgi:hypothetical protein
MGLAMVAAAEQPNAITQEDVINRAMALAGDQLPQGMTPSSFRNRIGLAFQGLDTAGLMTPENLRSMTAGATHEQAQQLRDARDMGLTAESLSNVAVYRQAYSESAQRQRTSVQRQEVGAFNEFIATNDLAYLTTGYDSPFEAFQTERGQQALRTQADELQALVGSSTGTAREQAQRRLTQVRRYQALTQDDAIGGMLSLANEALFSGEGGRISREGAAQLADMGFNSGGLITGFAESMTATNDTRGFNAFESFVRGYGGGDLEKGQQYLVQSGAMDSSQSIRDFYRELRQDTSNQQSIMSTLLQAPNIDVTDKTKEEEMRDWTRRTAEGVEKLGMALTNTSPASLRTTTDAEA